jgi:hypothetical protein
MEPTDELTREQAAAVLALAFAQAGAQHLLMGFFSEAPGVVVRPGRPRGLLRSAQPDSLEVGQWRFSIDESGGPRPRRSGTPPSRFLVSHVVRDVVLKTSDVGPEEGGRLFADAILTAASEAGPNPYAEVQGLLRGLAEVYGVA